MHAETDIKTTNKKVAFGMCLRILYFYIFTRLVLTKGIIAIISPVFYLFAFSLDCPRNFTRLLLVFEIFFAKIYFFFRLSKHFADIFFGSSLWFCYQKIHFFRVRIKTRKQMGFWNFKILSGHQYTIRLVKYQKEHRSVYKIKYCLNPLSK